MTKLLGIDYGRKKVGIALSDETGTVAFPKEIIKNDSELINHIAHLIDKENISKVVIGKSTDYKGEDNPVMEQIHQFKRALEKRLVVPIYFESEFLTSLEAQRKPKEVSRLKSRKQKVHKHIDASAAAIILQSFIDKNKNNI